MTNAKTTSLAVLCAVLFALAALLAWGQANEHYAQDTRELGHYSHTHDTHVGSESGSDWGVNRYLSWSKLYRYEAGGPDVYIQNAYDGEPDAWEVGTQTRKADGVVKTAWTNGYRDGVNDRITAEREPAEHRVIKRRGDSGDIDGSGPWRCHNPNTPYC